MLPSLLISKMSHTSREESLKVKRAVPRGHRVKHLLHQSLWSRCPNLQRNSLMPTTSKFNCRLLYCLYFACPKQLVRILSGFKWKLPILCSPPSQIQWEFNCYLLLQSTPIRQHIIFVSKVSKLAILIESCVLMIETAFRMLRWINRSLETRKGSCSGCMKRNFKD